MIKMAMIAAVLLVMIIVTSGIGAELYKRLDIKQPVFYAPMGFVFFLCGVQLLYYPAQIFHLSFKWILIATLFIFAIGLYLTVKNYKEVFKNIFQKKTLWVLISFIVFVVVFSQLFIDIEHSDACMYLNYASQNINIDRLNLFNLYTGAVGEEWDGLYLYQGYYHLMSFACYFINIFNHLGIVHFYVDNIVVCTWLFGMFYSVISSMVIVDIIEEIKIDNKRVNIALMIFTLGYSNFYYWRVAFSFYGNTYRTLFTTLLIFTIYQWVKYEDDHKRFIPFVIGAGLAASSTSLLTIFATMVCLMAYLFINKKENAFNDLANFVVFLVIYAVVMIHRMNLIIGIAIGICAICYYVFASTKFVKTIVSIIESFLYKYAKVLFYIVIPVACMAFSFYVNTCKPDYLINYSYAFQNHQNYDMVKDYSFRYSNLVDNILNVIRYIGIFMLLVNDKKDGFIKVLIIVMLLVFVNPFASTTIAYFIASNVFYRSIEVLFNPFSEGLMILCVFDLLKHKGLQSALCGVLIVITVVGHMCSWIDNNEGLYTFYVNGGKNVDPVVKLEPGEIKAIEFLRNEVEQNEDDHLVVISQAEGLRTYLPNAYLIFTARDQYYPYSRFNEGFYQIVRRHHPWDTHENDLDVADYTKSCLFLAENDVDYVITRYWENPEFDEASDACTTTLITDAEFKVKKVNKE